MCGRYTLLAEAEELAAEFDLAEPIRLGPSGFRARYNIAPSQNASVVRLSSPAGERRLDQLRWGLVPHWAKDPKIGFRTINARAETVATQPAFREAFRKRRCLVPASGFYEWRKAVEAGKEVKQPQYLHRATGGPMAMAGLWDQWSGPDGESFESFTIITTQANERVRAVHDRMPVILGRDDYETWLDPAGGPERLKSLLRPCPADWLDVTPVSRHVNSPRNDDPSCVEPLS